MCGIAGIFTNTPTTNHTLVGRVKQMCAKLRHRGPDGEGFWADECDGVALGHTRLSILDLTEAGRQPMISDDGRWVLVFNGEIYNHCDLRARIANISGYRNWRGNSDSETLLACFETWDFEQALREIVGMFALALWDRRDRVLRIARDRLGEKPLYYGKIDKGFAFASDINALRTLPKFSNEVCRSALSLYLQLGHVPAPGSIFKGIFKLMPGGFLEINCNDWTRGSFASKFYWKAIDYAVSSSLFDQNLHSQSQLINGVENYLKKSVHEQMAADVPFGAFLSGGVDSSLVVSLMQNLSSVPIRTFSIGFNEKMYDESSYAKNIANHLGANHTEHIVSNDDLLHVIPKLPTIYSEPFADPSAIPTYLVSVLARQHVKVCLTGDGADELFGGYNRYFLAARLWPYISALPRFARISLSKCINLIPPSSWHKVHELTKSILPKGYELQDPGVMIRKFSGVLGCSNGMDVYKKLTSSGDPTAILLRSHSDVDQIQQIKISDVDDLICEMMYADLVGYLPDDVLTKVDRATMAVSLEGRSPFLDHRLVEYAMKLPIDVKIRGGQGKWILRQILYKYVPKELIERPKMGFGPPVVDWLRGPLRGWAEAMLNQDTLNKQGYFNASAVKKMWKLFLSGHDGSWKMIWNVLMFQAWLEVQSFE